MKRYTIVLNASALLHFFESLLPVLLLLRIHQSHSFHLQQTQSCGTRQRRFLMNPFSTKVSPMNPLRLQPNDDTLFLEKILGVAIVASKKAGQIILENSSGAEVTNRKASSRDLLTLIDPLCEKVRQSCECVCKKKL